MNQRDATVKVILHFREHPEGVASLDNDKELGRAIKVLEKRAEVLRIRLERMRTAMLCACQQHRTSGLVCWRCWAAVPIEVRAAYEDGTSEERGEALRKIFEVAGGRRVSE